MTTFQPPLEQRWSADQSELFRRVAVLEQQATYSSGVQQLGTVILTSSQPSISIPVPAGYSHLQGIFTLRQDSTSGGAFALLRFNGDSGNNYDSEVLFGHNATTSPIINTGISGMNIGVGSGPTDTANYYGTGSFVVGNVSSAVFKSASSQYQCLVTSSNGYSGTGGGLWRSTAAITSAAIVPSSGNLVAGSCLTIIGLM